MMKKFIHICTRGFKIFEILKNGGVLSNLVCFVSECDIEQIHI